MKDTMLTSDGKREVEILNPCAHLGSRTENLAKKDCKEATYLPVYGCPRYRLCSPFGKVVDADLIQPCQDCPKYSRVQSGTAPVGTVKMND